jgi:hypothetical protein
MLSYFSRQSRQRRAELRELSRAARERSKRLHAEARQRAHASSQRLLEDLIDHTERGLLDWASDAGIELDRGSRMFYWSSLPRELHVRRADGSWGRYELVNERARYLEDLIIKQQLRAVRSA